MRRACLILPATGEDLQRAAALADRAIELGRKHGYYGFFMATKSLADYRLGRFESAIDWAQKAGARGVWMPITRLAMAMAQHRQGKVGQACQTLAEPVRSYDWSASKADSQDPWIAHVLRREAEALILPHLSAYLAGTYQPQDNQERLELVKPCRIARRDVAETRLHASLFAADPKLADDRKAGHRYNAACAAALAAAGKGIDAGKLDDKDCRRLRQQALDWLRGSAALDQASRQRQARQFARWCGRRSRTGRQTPASPVSATKTRWPGCPLRRRGGVAETVGGGGGCAGFRLKVGRPQRRRHCPPGRPGKG